MLTATRLGDGWLWLATAALLAASGDRGFQVLSAGAVAAGVANALLVFVKRRVRRARPCERANHPFDVDRRLVPVGPLLSPATPSTRCHRQRHRPFLTVAVRSSPRGERPARVVLGLHWLSTWPGRSGLVIDLRLAGLVQ
jgi:hypothetical protein